MYKKGGPMAFDKEQLRIDWRAAIAGTATTDKQLRADLETNDARASFMQARYNVTSTEYPTLLKSDATEIVDDMIEDRVNFTRASCVRVLVDEGFRGSQDEIDMLYACRGE